MEGLKNLVLLIIITIILGAASEDEEIKKIIQNFIKKTEPYYTKILKMIDEILVNINKNDLNKLDYLIEKKIQKFKKYFLKKNNSLKKK